MIIREDVNDIAVIRFAHGKVSALDVDFCTAVVAELASVSSSGARALILTGTGSAFSAGVDLFRVLKGGADYLRLFLPAMEGFFTALITFRKPLIAAINGHAIAGGCIIASACDHRVMAESTGRIGVPELVVGVPFPALPFEMVRARVSMAKFRELVLSGRTVAADEALTLGLVDEVAPADVLLTRALHAAKHLITIPPISFALTRQAFAEPILERVRKSGSLNDEVIAAWSSAEVQARMRAYVEQVVGKK
jgi:enoyl-CoA hydratase